MSDPRKIVRLNPRQREAVEHVHGPMLVVAGAGTGKTTVLTRRIAHLVENHHASAGEILAVTYTDDAAREMQFRSPAGVVVQTFHAYCNGVLRRAGKEFGVLDDKDLWIYLRRRIPELKLEYFIKAADLGHFLNDLIKFFTRCHDELRTPADYATYVEKVASGQFSLPRVVPAKQFEKTPRDEIIGRCREIARVYDTVERMLAKDGLGTYGHMITNAVALLRRDATVLRGEQAKANFILIDEFQDANLAQIELAHLLAGDGGNVFAVGDPDQAIYQFRGATAAAFEQFLARFKPVKSVTLEENQRSSPPILRCAFAAVAKNPEIVKGELRFQRAALRSARDEHARAAGEHPDWSAVGAVVVPGDYEEAAEVAGRIRELRDQLGLEWRDFAVLYRSHRHRRMLVEEFAHLEVPFAVRNLDVKNTPAARDILAVLRVLVDANDSISLLRVASFPKFRVDGRTLRDALAVAGRDARLPDVLATVPGGKSALDALARLRADAERQQWRSAKIFGTVVARLGLNTQPEVTAALQAFIDAWSQKSITRTGDVAEFLEYLDYFVEAKGSVAAPTPAEHDLPDKVQLMTVHGAKGLEYRHVFVVHVQSQSFPGNYHEPLFEFPQELRDCRAGGEPDSKEAHHHEERRLFYVAMTRARDSLTLLGKPKKMDLAPAKYMRELLEDKSIQDVIVRRNARPYRIDVAAAAQPFAVSSIEPWVDLEPRDALAQQALSVSAIDAYQSCPLKFKLQRDWRLPEQPVAAMQYGAVIHTVLKDFFDAAQAGRPRPLGEVIRIFREALEKAGIENDYQRELYRAQGERQLTAVVESAQQTMPQVLSTERSFDVQIGGARVVGRVDRLDRCGSGIAIIDYKTGSPKTQDAADDSLQLAVYAIAAQRAWKMQPERLVFHNLENNEEIVTTRTSEELKEIEEQVRAVAEGIRAGNFTATPNEHTCGYCAYRDICPETEERLYTIQPAAKATGVN